MTASAWVQVALALALAPLFPGVVNRVKAWFAGRTGPPVHQLYLDLARLARKGAVFSDTATWVFAAGPVAGVAALVTACALVPLGAAPAPLAFPGDLVVVAALLAAARFAALLAALDTGSSFEGMGANREAAFAPLAEVALLLGLAAVAHETGSLSLSGMFAPAAHEAWLRTGPAWVLVAAALLLVFLAEKARIPVDDPATHLELTMIHEVMALDHSGPDLALIHYGAALKLWVLGCLVVGLVVPASGLPWLDRAAGLAGLLGLALVVGVIESTVARVRLARVNQLLVGAGAMAVVALALVSR
jgi:formate hydrogenlyase subunit 4